MYVILIYFKMCRCTKPSGEGCLSGASAQQHEELKEQVHVPRMQHAMFTERTILSQRLQRRSDASGEVGHRGLLLL